MAESEQLLLVSLPELYHLVALYDKVPEAALCTLESLVNSLTIASGADIGESDVIIMVCVSNKKTFDLQYSDFLASIADIIKKQDRKISLNIREATMDSLLVGTPLGHFYDITPADKLGRYEKQNKANALRLALLYKYGGFYMDLDMVVFKEPRFHLPGPGLGLENKDHANNAALLFPSAKSSFLEHSMESFVENYDGDSWVSKELCRNLIQATLIIRTTRSTPQRAMAHCIDILWQHTN